MMYSLNEIKALSGKILGADVTSMDSGRRFAFRALTIAWALVQDMRSGQLSLRAMSLVYTTLITFVPLLAFSFSVLKGFDVHNKVKPMLQGMFEGLGPEKSAEVTERVIGFVDNIQVGVLGIVGFALLLYAVISLMNKIENAFNYIWRIQKARSLARRFGDYLSVIFVGPLLLFLSTGLTAAAGNSGVIHWLSETGQLGWLLSFISILVPWIVMALAFAFIYAFMPNTKVKIFPALAGGLATAFCWKLMGWVFKTFVAGSASYVAIYAAFATLIIFMIWLYLCWLVMLLGSSLSFYLQNPSHALVSRDDYKVGSQGRMQLGLGIVSMIGQAFYNRKTAPDDVMISEALHAPVLAVQKTLAALERGGILTEGGEKGETYLPAVPFDQTSLADLVKVLIRDGYEKKVFPLPNQAAVIWNGLLDHIDQGCTDQSIYDALIAPRD